MVNSNYKYILIIILEIAGHCSLAQNIFKNEQDSILFNLKSLDKVNENTLLYENFLFQGGEVVLKGISKDEFLDGYFNERHNPITFFHKDSLLHEAVDTNYVLRRGPELIHSKTGSVLRNNDSIQYFYSGNIRGYILIGFKRGEIMVIFIYTQSNFKRLKKILPFVSIVSPDKKTILASTFKDYYISPKGNFELFTVCDQEFITIFSYTADQQNNWFMNMPFFIRENKVFFIYERLDDKGNIIRDKRFFAEIFLKM